MRPRRRPALRGSEVRSLGVATLLAVAACSGAVAREPSIEVNDATVRHVTESLAHPRLSGRAAGQPGGVLAAEYLASQFQALGLRPLPGQTSFLLPVDVQGYTVLSESEAHVAGEALRYLEDFVFMPFHMAWRPVRGEQRVTGEVVFVGRGLSDPSLGRADLDGVHLAGKIALLVDPVDAEEPIGRWAAVDDAGVVTELARRGAAAVLWIGPERLPESITFYGTRRSVAFASVPPGLPSEPMPVAMLSAPVARRLLERAGMRLEDLLARLDSGAVSRPLGVTGSLLLRTSPDPATSPAFSVAGYLPGSDRDLGPEAVVLTAHPDGYGVQPDGVYPGAADNALGVARLVAIAEALRASRPAPRRSVVFLAPTAHEASWMLGSTDFLRRGVWPVERITANLNLDGIGSEVWGPVRMLHVMGWEQTDLQGLIRQEAERLGVAVEPDVFTGSRILQRSDGFQFARCGIPFVYAVGYPAPFDSLGARFGETFSEVVHFPGDTVRSAWYWAGAGTMARLYLSIARRIADAPQAPRWAERSPLTRSRGCGR